MASPSYTGRKFRAGLAAFLLGRAAQALATFALMLLAVRWLPLGEYGAYMLVWGLCELAVPLTSLGLLQALQQFLPRLAAHANRREVRRFVRTMAAARLALTLGVIGLMLLFWPRIAGWFGLTLVADLSSGLLVAALIVAVLGARYVAEVLECLLEQRDAQLVRALQPVARLVGLAGLWFSGNLNLTRLLWVDLLVSLAALAWGQWMLARRLRALSPDGELVLPWREVRSFVGHMSLSQGLVAAGDAGAVRLIAGRVLGLEAAGIFAFLQQLTVTANRYLPSILLANVVRPMLVVRHAAGDLATVGVGVAVLWKMNLALMCGALAVVIVGGDGLLVLLSGGAAQAAGLPMALLLVGLLGSAMSQIVAMALQIHGLASRVTLVSLAAPTTLLCAWYGGLHGGLLGLAWGVAVSMWLRAAVVMATAQTGPQRAPLDWSGALRLILATVGVVALGAWLGRYVGTLWAAALAAGLYVALLLWLKPLNATEGELIGRGLGHRGHWIRAWSRPR